MKKSHLLMVAPALSSVHRDISDLISHESRELAMQGHRLRSQSAHRTLQHGGQYLQAIWHKLSQALARHRQRRSALRTLRAMDQHLLRDIGLHEADLRQVVEQQLEGKHTHHLQLFRPSKGKVVASRIASNDAQTQDRCA